MARYEPDYGATGRWLRNDRELYQAVFAAARQIASQARVIAPVDSGEYRDRIEVSAGRGWDGRVAADVAALAAHSAAVEFGNRRTRGRGQHVLARAAEYL